MGTRIGIALAGIGLLAAPAALAADAPPTVIQCEGSFYDLGQVTPVRSLYRIGAGDVQVWRPSSRTWIHYVCTDHCSTDPRQVTVSDRYVTARRGWVNHVLDLHPESGRLDEEWRVGSDVLQYSATCARAADPAPHDTGLKPSTRGGDYTLYSIADGLPLPIPRRPYEPTLRLIADSSYRSSTSRP